MDKVEKPTASRKMTEDFNSGGYAAKEVVSLDSVYKRYGTNMLLNNVNISIGRNDRIALIGANGCGKTTLLKLILGEDACDSGVVKVSSNIKIAYMPQIITFDDENATVLETLRSAVGLPEEKIRSMLVSFQFRGPDILKKVGSLSGGEKSRLKLCLLMQNKANFLILDEPTNHLDIDSREWIENAVADWDCTMLFISHDRYFLNKFASKIWSMKDGRITVFDGGFEDYLIATANAESQPNTNFDNKKKKKSSGKAIAPPKSPVSFKPQVLPETLIYASEAELDALDKEIETCLADSDYEKIKTLYQKKQQIETHIALLYDQWAKDSDDEGL